MTSIFENRDEILNSEEKEAKEKTLQILKAGIVEAIPERTIRKNVSLKDNVLKVLGRRFDLREFEDIWVVGAGKASHQMAQEMESILQDRISEGIVVNKFDYEGEELDYIETVEGGHPIPDENSVEGGKRVLDIAEKAGKNDLVINLVSGGGSSLLCAPVGRISLGDVKTTTDLLVSSGATIDEINSVRKHISKIKGGNLLRKIQPAKTVSLIVSDVVGDDVEVISSGPTAPDRTTFEDAEETIRRYSLKDRVPADVLDHLESEKSQETLDKEKFENMDIENMIISSNDTATEAAARKAKDLGLTPLILSRMIEGESHEIGVATAGLVRDIKRTGKPVEAPCVIISGGETTVTLGDYGGEGGPNQEFSLGAAQKISGMEGISIAAVDTDGNDGPTEKAGGIVDGNTVQELKEEGLSLSEVLKKHESTKALEKIGGALITGPTGTNVNDLRVAVLTCSHN